MQKLLLLQLYHHTSDHIQSYNHTFRQVTLKFLFKHCITATVRTHSCLHCDKVPQLSLGLVRITQCPTYSNWWYSLMVRLFAPTAATTTTSTPRSSPPSTDSSAAKHQTGGKEHVKRLHCITVCTLTVTYILQLLNEDVLFFFWFVTALHRMQTRSSGDNSVCLSVRLSDRLPNACIVTKQKKKLSRILYHTKEHLA